jgi:hypothetical protein
LGSKDSNSRPAQVKKKKVSKIPSQSTSPGVVVYACNNLSYAEGISKRIAV